MTLAASRDVFIEGVFSLWTQDPIPPTSTFSRIIPFVETYWNSAIVDGYTSLTISPSYVEFEDYVSRMESGELASSELPTIADRLEELFREVPINSSFGSSDSGIVFRVIRVKSNSEASNGELSSVLLELLEESVEEEVADYRAIITAIADFFLGWEVEVDDSGTIVTAAII